MDKISRKMGNVAAFPMKLDLQLFAEEEAIPSLEDSPEWRDDAKEFNTKMDALTKEYESKAVKETPESVEKIVENEPVKEVVKAEIPEVAVPDDKPKQDSETNKAFQEMRQKLEAAEKEKADIAKRADETISRRWGHLGIHTVEQYEQREREEKETEDNERYTTAGLTQEEIDAIRKAPELQRETEVMKQERIEQEKIFQWDALYKAYPDIVESSKLFGEQKDPEWYTAEMKAELARGASPLAAYRNAHFETILANATKGTKEAAKQEALNQINSKSHMKPSGADGGNVDHVEIDAQQMALYRKLTGKTDAQIRAFHKKQLAGG